MPLSRGERRAPRSSVDQTASDPSVGQAHFFLHLAGAVLWRGEGPQVRQRKRKRVGPGDRQPPVVAVAANDRGSMRFQYDMVWKKQFVPTHGGVRKYC